MNMRNKIINVSVNPKIDKKHRWYLELAGTAKHLIKYYGSEIPEQERDNFYAHEGHHFTLQAIANRLGVNGNIHYTQENGAPKHFFFVTSSGMIIDPSPNNKGPFDKEIYISPIKKASPEYANPTLMRKSVYYNLWRQEQKTASNFVKSHRDDLVMLRITKPWRLRILSLFNFF